MWVYDGAPFRSLSKLVKNHTFDTDLITMQSGHAAGAVARSHFLIVSANFLLMLTVQQQLVGWVLVLLVVLGLFFGFLKAREWVRARQPDPLADPNAPNHVHRFRLRDLK